MIIGDGSGATIAVGSVLADTLGDGTGTGTGGEDESWVRSLRSPPTTVVSSSAGSAWTVEGKSSSGAGLSPGTGRSGRSAGAGAGAAITGISIASVFASMLVSSSSTITDGLTTVSAASALAGTTDGSGFAGGAGRAACDAERAADDGGGAVREGDWNE